jgi:hypothetical protein
MRSDSSFFFCIMASWELVFLRFVSFHLSGLLGIFSDYLLFKWRSRFVALFYTVCLGTA